MYLYIGMDLTLWRGLSDLVGMSCFFWVCLFELQFSWGGDIAMEVYDV